MENLDMVFSSTRRASAVMTTVCRLTLSIISKKYSKLESGFRFILSVHMKGTLPGHPCRKLSVVSIIGQVYC